MKKKFQLLNCVAALFIAITSCHKENNNGYVATPVIDTLRGKEFSFSDLTWEYYNSGAGSPSWDEIYLITPARPELFYNRNLNAEVFLKFDTAANWVEVKSDGQYNPILPLQYLYITYSPHLVINVWPLNFQLVGRKASIKVKFL